MLLCSYHIICARQSTWLKPLFDWSISSSSCVMLVVCVQHWSEIISSEWCWCCMYVGHWLTAGAHTFMQHHSSRLETQELVHRVAHLHSINETATMFLSRQLWRDAGLKHCCILQLFHLNTDARCFVFLFCILTSQGCVWVINLLQTFSTETGLRVRFRSSYIAALNLSGVALALLVHSVCAAADRSSPASSSEQPILIEGGF